MLNFSECSHEYMTDKKHVFIIFSVFYTKLCIFMQNTDVGIFFAFSFFCDNIISLFYICHVSALYNMWHWCRYRPQRYYATGYVCSSETEMKTHHQPHRIINIRHARYEKGNANATTASRRPVHSLILRILIFLIEFSYKQF